MQSSGTTEPEKPSEDASKKKKKKARYLLFARKRIDSTRLNQQPSHELRMLVSGRMFRSWRGILRRMLIIRPGDEILWPARTMERGSINQYHNNGHERGLADVYGLGALPGPGILFSFRVGAMSCVCVCVCERGCAYNKETGEHSQNFGYHQKDAMPVLDNSDDQRQNPDVRALFPCNLKLRLFPRHMSPTDG